jgi:hypothetical protein
MAKHNQCRKTSGRHTTVTEFANDFVNWAKKQRWVTRISNGYITNGLKNSRQSVRLQEGNGCLIAKLKRNRSAQKLIVYLDLDEITYSDASEEIMQTWY